MATDVYEMNEAEFKAALATKTTPDEVWKNAAGVEVYDWLSSIFGQNCGDSVLREWAFQWWTDAAPGRDYEDIYERWLGEDD